MPRQPRSDTFLNDDDREDFVRRLSLLLKPTRQPLAPLMRRLLTGYAVAFNLRHKRSGHLFQNRYKSIVCDDEAYLLGLVRYIHLNPLRAGAVKTLEELADYRWSGHRQLLGLNGPELIDPTALLPLFAKGKKAAMHRYLQFLADGIATGPPVKLSSGGRRTSQAYNPALQDDELFDERILGGGDFVDQVLGAASGDAGLSLSLEEVIALIAAHCQVAAADLAMPSKQPAIVRAKALICHVATRICRYRGAEVGQQLAYSTSAVSRAAIRGQKLYAEDGNLRGLHNKPE